MIDVSLEKLEPEDVDSLSGLTLSIALAIHVFGWRWYERPNDNLPLVLLDSRPFSNRKLNKDFFRYIGDNRYVAKSLPEFEKKLRLIIELVNSLETSEERWLYVRHLEEEIHSSNHFRLIQANADQRCRAFLKMRLKYKSEPAEEKEETEESASKKETTLDED